MKRLYPLLILLTLSSCSVFDKEEGVPGFIVITENDLVTVEGQGANTINAPDVHVFANEQFVGTYELPARIAILETGPTRINVSAGIKNNGISSDRIIYPFYAPINKVVDIIPDAAIPFEDDSVAVYEYFPLGTLTFFEEDFESIGTTLSRPDTSLAQIFIINEPSEVLSGLGSGRVLLTESRPFFEARTTWNMTNLPLGQEMYLEIDFRGTVPLEIGVRTLDPVVSSQFVAGLVAQDEWTKVYIQMSTAIARNFQTNAFQLYFASIKDQNSVTDTLFIDNIKFIHPN